MNGGLKIHRNQANRLKMLAVTATYDEGVARAAQNKASYPEYLALRANAQASWAALITYIDSITYTD